MNVMEEALVDIKESSATLISNQQQDKTEVVNEINKWKRSMNQMFCCFIDCEFNIGHFFWDCIQTMCA
jgi:hypothetical protein